MLPKIAFFSENALEYKFCFWQSYVCGKKKSFSPEDGELSGKNEKERIDMKNNNQITVPQAREAMDRFKMQAAQEVGVNLQNGYNGHLTSREAGSVGGQMVKKMIEAYEQGLQ